MTKENSQFIINFNTSKDKIKLSSISTNLYLYISLLTHIELILINWFRTNKSVS